MRYRRATALVAAVVGLAGAQIPVAAPGAAAGPSRDVAGMNPQTRFDIDPADIGVADSPPAARRPGAPGSHRGGPYQEREPADTRGRNDAVQAAERVGALPPRRARPRRATVTGTLAPQLVTGPPTLQGPDVDVFAVELAAGDTLGAGLDGAAKTLTIRDPAGRVVMGSSQDLSMQYPPDSPLRANGGANAVADHVAARAGRYTVAVSAGAGSYTLDLVAYPLRHPRRPQTIFLDFDGARVDTSIFSGSGLQTDFGPRRFRPLADYLPGWGLGPEDEDALIGVIARTVRVTLQDALAAQGRSADRAFRILTSLDAPDTFGEPDVSRVVIGGSSTETKLPTVGIASSVDPGNIDREETAVVQLDKVSGPATARLSLNAFLTADSDRIRFVGRSLGRLAVHEIGHYLGSYHTDGDDDDAQVMDAAGDAGQFFGVGPDGVGGTDDDVDIHFGRDTFRPAEGFTGTQDSAARTAFGLPGAAQRPGTT